MMQLVGVIALALRLREVFHSIHEANTIDHTVPVAGLVMRVAVIFLWLRAARQEQPRRQACPAYAVTNGVAQVGWVT